MIRGTVRLLATSTTSRIARNIWWYLGIKLHYSLYNFVENEVHYYDSQYSTRMWHDGAFSVHQTLLFCSHYPDDAKSVNKTWANPHVFSVKAYTPFPCLYPTFRFLRIAQWIFHDIIILVISSLLSVPSASIAIDMTLRWCWQGLCKGDHFIVTSCRK